MTYLAKSEIYAGPWNDFEIVDGANAGDVVGIKNINDGSVFTV